jgi:hypothetical protein
VSRVLLTKDHALVNVKVGQEHLYLDLVEVGPVGRRS